uniref:Uncharacterized protein n=1 Tax=Steinernema glaseri TaxID=37863 RepID=A0A1I8A7J6_9BILA
MFAANTKYFRTLPGTRMVCLRMSASFFYCQGLGFTNITRITKPRRRKRTLERFLQSDDRNVSKHDESKSYASVYGTVMFNLTEEVTMTSRSTSFSCKSVSAAKSAPISASIVSRRKYGTKPICGMTLDEFNTHDGVKTQEQYSQNRALQWGQIGNGLRRAQY